VFFPALTKEVLEENRAWLQPRFMSPKDELVLCIQSYLVQTPHHNILIDTCVGNDKPRARPFWNLTSPRKNDRGPCVRFETAERGDEQLNSRARPVVCSRLSLRNTKKIAKKFGKTTRRSLPTAGGPIADPRAGVGGWSPPKDNLLL
jgi:hypothetical protein